MNRTQHPALFLLSLQLLWLCAGAASAQPPADNDASTPGLFTNSLRDQRARWIGQRRAYPLSEIPDGAKARALRQISQAKAPSALRAASASAERWGNVGPSPIQSGAASYSGRIGDIAVDPADLDHWFIGAAQGGIWETRDAGANWTPRTDDQASLAMGAITFAPGSPNVIYAGTGEAVFSFEAYAGAGLLKSTDGGTNWQLLAAAVFAQSSFSDIKVNPTNANVLVVTTGRGVAGRTKAGTNGVPVTAPPRGIFKSTDGGTIWSQQLFGEATDLEVDPGNFDRQYAALGEIFGRSTNGVYRSLNAGDTWSLVSGPWFAAAVGNLGRIELAVAPSNPDTLYVSVAIPRDASVNSGRLLGLWRTDNAWDTVPNWTPLPATSSGSQLWYDHEIIVDPGNRNVLYLGELALQKFNGSSWADVTDGLHVDQHCMAWAGVRLIVGNDGGLYSTPDGGAHWDNHNQRLSITQLYAGSLHPTNPNFALGGTQDNGTLKWTGNNAWTAVFGGDGGFSAIAATDPDNNWAVSYQNLNILRTKNGGASFADASVGLDKANALFIAPVVKCPGNDDLFLAGTDNLWKCTNFFSGASAAWFANSPDWQATEGASVIPSRISAIAFAPSDATFRTYALGTAEGLLRLTSDGGNTWVNVDPTNAVPDRYVTGLAFSASNASVLYVALSGFDEGTPAQPGHVFKTTNALAAAPRWFNVSPPVNLPQNALVTDPANPDTIYTGSDVGVWRSRDAGASWMHLGPEAGMPNVAVFDLQISRPAGRVMAFTHGRGAFVLVPPADTDGDGLPDDWELRYFGSLNATDGDPGDDPDHDGMTNAQELLAGTDPTATASVLRVTAVQVVGADVRLSFASVAGKKYRLERSDRVTGSSWTVVVDNLAGLGGVMQTADIGGFGQTNQFYRLRLVP